MSSIIDSLKHHGLEDLAKRLGGEPDAGDKAFAKAARLLADIYAASLGGAAAEYIPPERRSIVDNEMNRPEEIFRQQQEWAGKLRLAIRRFGCDVEGRPEQRAAAFQDLETLIWGAFVLGSCGVPRAPVEQQNR